MGKLTINGHVQWLCVCLPEGRGHNYGFAHKLGGPSVIMVIPSGVTWREPAEKNRGFDRKIV